MGWLRYEEGLAVYMVFSISNSMRDAIAKHRNMMKGYWPSILWKVKFKDPFILPDQKHLHEVCIMWIKHKVGKECRWCPYECRLGWKTSLPNSKHVLHQNNKHFDNVSFIECLKNPHLIHSTPGLSIVTVTKTWCSLGLGWYVLLIAQRPV